ncbi:DNA methyltransferase [soil metagenome]
MPATRTDAVLTALKTFARQVKADAELGTRIKAGPEDQLKVSVRALVIATGAALHRNVSILSESPVEDVGRPDLAIAVDGLLVGYIELKAPGEGTTDQELKGRNKAQLTKFRNLPNLIYTDANDWTFYQKSDTGDKSSRKRSFDVRLGDLTEDGDREITGDEAGHLLELFRGFLKWQPIVPTNPRALAEQLAPLTRMLRDDVEAGSQIAQSALARIYEDWQRTLFPDATADEFADSYAQTFTYGLLLAKLSGATTLDTHGAAQAIMHHSSLLARTLEILTQQGTREELGVGLDLLERTIEAVDPAVVGGKGDPWLYFYEDFLAVYDPKLRNERGVYYTPAQVVKAQVTLVDELLKTKLGRPDGVADGDVTVLDPALGTGTYLLQTLQHGVDHAAKRYGPGGAGSTATQMANNLYGFELLVGPYAVAHLRMTQAIHEAGGREPADGTHIYLTDTLESPNEVGSLPHSYFEAPLAEEHRRAREVKQQTKILVCIGNPPYERDISDPGQTDRAVLGGWIRFGDQGTTETGPLFEDFLRPAREAGAGGVLQPIYNLYVYFWRWALWKVFDTQDGPGIVSFITASSYLRGPGFVGMREEMRRTFDDLWILDLEGGSLGARKTENVFDIRTPVAIAVGIRSGSPNRDQPADVHYAKFAGNRAEKFGVLESINSLSDVEWQEGQIGWHKPFLPDSEGDFFIWPRLDEVLPWSRVGCLTKRNWPISESQDVLNTRCKRLFDAPVSERTNLLQATSSRGIYGDRVNRLRDSEMLPSIAEQQSSELSNENRRYAYRSFDRQWIVADERFIDRPATDLWGTVGNEQMFLTTAGSYSFGFGPAAVFTRDVPDQNSFNNRGGRVVPLYRDAAATEPNITHGLLDLLGEAYGAVVTPEDLIGYIAGVLGHSGYTERFHDELEVPGPRVPLTKDADMFQRAADLGKQVIAWQTYAERFPESIGTTQGYVPRGNATLLKAITDDPEKYPQNLREVQYDDAEQELRVGEGVFGDVDPRILAYEVSGLRVVRSWLGYRMRERSGRKSSPLDDIRPERWTGEMTRELQHLLWVLEGVIALEPAQDELLGEIVAGEMFLAEELPHPTDAERAAPKADRQQQMGLGGEFGT